MTDRNDGGPAFPVDANNFPNPSAYFGSPGLSVRDYFAAAALTGLGTWSPSATAMDLKARADIAYAQADAMLAARAKP